MAGFVFVMPALALSRACPLPQAPHRPEDYGYPVGAGVPAKGPAQATNPLEPCPWMSPEAPIGLSLIP